MRHCFYWFNQWFRCNSWDDCFWCLHNEASLANQAVFNEIDSRCSAKGARIICDTNPDNPEHWLKKDYIDNQNDDAKIVSFHFTIDDKPHS